MSRSENDFRTMLIHELYARLRPPYVPHNSNSVVLPLNKKIGRVREFDIVILDEKFVSDSYINPDRVMFVGETKNPRVSTMGQKQAEDGLIAYPNAVATFATNFEDGLYWRCRDQPEKNFSIVSDKKKVTMDVAIKIVGEINEILDHDASKMGVIDESSVINKLRDCVKRIEKEMTEITPEGIETLTKSTFVLWQKVGQKLNDVTRNYSVLRASSYIIVTQLIFYDLLYRYHTKHKLPALKLFDIETEQPILLWDKYFKRVHEITGDFDAVFEIEPIPVASIPQTKSVMSAINDVIEYITKLKLPFMVSDFIGKVFHELIPLELRKSIAAYYTGSAAASLLAHLSIDSPDAKICDLACGSGTLLVESYHVLMNLMKKRSPNLSDGQVHNQIIEKQLFGNDITIFASNLAGMNLLLQDLDEITRWVNIGPSDGLQLNPEGRKIMGPVKPLVDGQEKMTTIDVGSGEKQIVYPYVDLVIMNPPFARSMNFDKDMKDNLEKIIGNWNWDRDENPRDYINKRIGLHGYFMIHADHFLKKGGRIAFILPASTFTSTGTVNFLSYFGKRGYAIEYVIEILNKSSTFSEGCTFKEYEVILKKGALCNDSMTKLITITGEINLENVSSIIDAIRFNKNDKIVKIKEIPTRDLYNSNKWTELFVNDNLITDNVLKSKMLMQLSESRVKVTGGYVGYTNYLSVSNKEWKLSHDIPDAFNLRHEMKPDDDVVGECRIPSKYLIPAIIGCGEKYGTNKLIIDKIDHYIFNLPSPPLPPDLSDFQRIYLHWAMGKIRESNERARKKGRSRIDPDKDVWFVHKNDIQPTHLFHCRFYRPRILRSLVLYSTEETITNMSFHLIYTPDDKFYASYFNSCVYISEVLQKQSPLYPGCYQVDFNNVHVPRYESFDKETIHCLVDRWEKLASVKKLDFLPGQFTSPPPGRVALDEAWLAAMGVEDVGKAREELYKWLREYMEKR